MNYKSAPYGKRNSLAVIVIISLALGAVLGSYGTASLFEKQQKLSAQRDSIPLQPTGGSQPRFIAKVKVQNDTMKATYVPNPSYTATEEELRSFRENPTFSKVSGLIYLDHSLQSDCKSFFSESAEAYTLK